MGAKIQPILCAYLFVSLRYAAGRSLQSADISALRPELDEIAGIAQKGTERRLGMIYKSVSIFWRGYLRDCYSVDDSRNHTISEVQLRQCAPTREVSPILKRVTVWFL